MNDTTFINIIILPLNQITHPVQHYLLTQSKAILTTQEAKHAESYYHHEDKIRYKITRTLLKHLISEALNIPINPFILTANNYGKPMYDGIHFSVSKRHCGIAIAASCSPLIQALGIDIEAHHEKHEWAEMAKLCMCSDELLNVNSGQDFYRYWTAKEAAVKALGTGLSFPLPSVKVNMARQIIQFCSDNNEYATPNQPWYLRVHQQSDWTLAIVYDNPLVSINYILPSIHNHKISFKQNFPLKDNNT